MLRLVLGCAFLAVLSVPCRADPTITALETRVRLSVSATPAPRPALKYLLLPELHEMNPGNPCFHYLKCFMEQQKFFFDRSSVQRREALLSMPLKDLPVEELRDYGAVALSQADWAARLETPDWDVLLKLKQNGPAILLSDVQQLQTLARALRVRFRGEVAQGQFRQAIRTVKTLLAMARHLGEHPTVVGNLEGIAIANQAVSALDELLEQPGCPNLYWGLTNLPHPLVALNKGLGGERDIFRDWFRDLDETTSMSDDQLGQLVAFLEVPLAHSKPERPGGVKAWLEVRARDEGQVRAARHRLVEYGFPEERLLRFPAAQVILLDEKREYEVRRDDILKLLSLPAHQAIPLSLRLEADQGRFLFVEPLTGGLLHVTRSQARLSQRIALLRHVEALRLYAAEHGGTLPAKLADASVPLPDDPFTGQPFRYEVHGHTAQLRGSPPSDEEKNPLCNLIYEVELRE